MKPAARIQASIELLESLHQAWEAKRAMPVDAMMASYFKARRYVGSKDRGAISDLTYKLLRHGGALEWHIERTNRAATPRRVAMAGLMLLDGHDVDAIEGLFNGDQYCPAALLDADRGMLERLEGKTIHDATMPMAARLNYPDWMEGRLQDAFGDQLEAALHALNSQAPIDLRVNTIRCPSRADLLLSLDREGYVAAPTPHAPLGVRLTKRLPAFNTQAFRDGWYEMQDEGSQIAAQLVQAKKGEKVIDFCAGAGGKTLAIAAHMENKGRILALDVSETRLKQLPKRLARAGVSNTQIKAISHENDPWLKRHRASADWVLVDAPCSGSGTWRRNPDLKWRFGPNDLAEVKTQQEKILHAASLLVKPGGKLVYVTCSIFPDENIGQIKQFLVHNANFRVEPVPKIWSRFAVVLEGTLTTLQLSPHQDGTDGFFAAILTRST